MVTGETETFGQRTEDNIGQYTATLLINGYGFERQTLVSLLKSNNDL